MSVEANKDAMRRALKAYGEGDFQPVLQLLHRDVVWTTQAPSALFRFGGVHHGHVEAVIGVSTIATDYTLHRYEIAEMIGEGDVVWMNARLDVTERKSGKHFGVALASRWEFRDGKAIGLTEYFDSATVALLQGSVAAAESLS
ncbi:MAG: nuclear transport factor 2 family protein [Rhizomicrobium sp.]